MPQFDPYDPEQFARLRKSVRWNYEKGRSFRRVRERVMGAARGHYYDCERSNPEAERNPVNMLDQWVQTLVRSFVQSNPTARATSKENPRLGLMFQERLRRLIVETDLKSTLRECVQEALLGYIGTAYCGIAPTAARPFGEPFSDSIPLPDALFDFSHNKFNKMDIAGHRFMRRVDDLLDSGMYNNEEVEKHRKNSQISSETSDNTERERDQWDFREGALFDWMRVWAVHIRPANMIVYYPDTAGTVQPIRVESFDGPEYGPYVYLAFDDVPDHLLPNSRGALLLDQHKFVNSQYRRVMMKEDQAAEVFTYEGGAEEDARRFKNAQDGEFVRVENNNGVQRRTKGGTSPQALATAIHGRSLFDDSSGSVRSLGGGGPMAETLGQEQIAHANVSRLVRDMQLQVIDFTKRVLQNMAWYEWTDPVRTEKMEIKVGENGFAVQDLWSPEQREGDFAQFEIDIVPDSMEHRSSRQQLSELMNAVQGLVMPLMQFPTEKPVTIRVPELIAKYADLANLPELAAVADYAPDPSLVSQPSVQGSANRLPAGATASGSQAGGNQSNGGLNDQNIVDRVLAGAIQGGAGGGNEG